MGEIDKISKRWFTVLYILFEVNEASLKFASVGESINITCPYRNVDSWQKLDTQDLLATCENRVTMKNPKISNRITITDGCNNLAIKNFTMIDVGIYRCYIFRDTITQKYDFNITLPKKPRASVISSPSPPTVKKGHAIKLRCQTESDSYGTIDSFVWNHDGQLLPNTTRTIQYENVEIGNAGKYKCTAKNRAGEDSDEIEVIVTYPAVVQNQMVDFETNDSPRTLTCNVSGVPATFTYSTWLHYSYSNQLVRTLDGKTNGTLILPNDESEDPMYEDRGIYICNVTNNIPDEYDHLWQTGWIKVIIKGGLKRPTIIRLQSSSNNIYVEFKPVIVDDSLQTLVIEYRKASTGPWIRREIDNSHTQYDIKNLESSTEYVLRMYALNKLGNSTVTEEYSILTKGGPHSSGTKYIGFSLGCAFLACLIFIWWRYRKAKKIDPHRSEINEQHIQEGGIIVNHLYGSADGPNVSPSTSSRRVEHYSSIERRKQNVHCQKVAYKIAAERKLKKQPETMELADRPEWKGKIKTSSSALNYIDVFFDPKPLKGKVYIHGADKKTPYADIDFTAKADPLISSDENDESSIGGVENDFVTLEDVMQWNITAD